MPPRQPILRTTRVAAATRLQDLSSLDQRILDQVNAGIVAPIKNRVEILEIKVAAIERGIVKETEIELRAGGRSGSVLLVPVEGFEPDTIDQPVLVQPYITEADAVLFSARVVNERSMLVHWFSVGPAPRTAKVVYLIG